MGARCEVFEVFELCASGEIGGGEYCNKRIHKDSAGAKVGFLEKHYTRLLWLRMNIIMWGHINNLGSPSNSGWGFESPFPGVSFQLYGCQLYQSICMPMAVFLKFLFSISAECTCTGINNFNEAYEQFCVEPKYIINSTQVPQFTAQPQSGVYHNQTAGVHLDCNITAVSRYSAVFVWECNGSVVHNASSYMIRNVGATSRRLYIP